MASVEDTSIQLCRLCLRNTTGCISLFSEFCDTDYIELSKIVKKCVGVEVCREDSFTCMICAPCHKMVLRFYAFKSMCLESQWRLCSMPLWEAKGPRDPLEDCGRENLQEVEVPHMGEEITQKQCSSTFIRKDDGKSNVWKKIWPVAIWSFSEGFWQSATCNSEECIISDPLDNEGKSMDPDDMESVIGFDNSETQTEDENRSLRPYIQAFDPSYEDHNYSSQPLSNEPLHLCSVVMEHAEEDEESGWGSVVGSGTRNRSGEKEMIKQPLTMSKEVNQGSDFKELNPPLSGPVDSVKAVNPIKAVNPKPIKAVYPLKAVNPMKVANPAVSPVKVGCPETADNPEKAVIHVEAEKPVKADNPEKPVNPVKAANSVKVNCCPMSLLKQKATDAKVSTASTGKTSIQRKGAELTQKLALSKPNASNSLHGVSRGHIISAKLNSGQIQMKNSVPNLAKRIVIKKNNTPGQAKHIPLVKGSRLTSSIQFPENTHYLLLKVKKTTQ